MKKLMMIVTAMVIASGAFGQNKVVTKASFLTLADRTVTTNYIDLAGGGYRSIDKVVVVNNGALGNLSSVATIVDEPSPGSSRANYTTFTTLTAAAGNASVTYPTRYEIGDVPVTTNSVPYFASKLRVINTLSATNATQAYLDFYIYSEE